MTMNITAKDRFQEICRKVEARQRLSFDDGIALYDPAIPLQVVAELADSVRERMHGNVAYYNINTHLNPTNVCIYRCRFCAFRSDLRDPKGYVMDERAVRARGQEAFENGWSNVKLYFMIGLPTETDEDLLGIADLAKKVVACYFALPREKRAKGLKVVVSASTFVPKPFTPFQWAAQDRLEEIRRKQGLLRNALNIRGVTFNWHDPETSFLEACFARGGRELSPVLLRAYELGCRLDGWSEHFNFQAWLQAYPTHNLAPDVQYWLPISYYYNGQYAEALPLFLDYAKNNPMNNYAPEALYRAACCRYALEEYQQCADDVAAWLVQNPNHYFRHEAAIMRGDALAVPTIHGNTEPMITDPASTYPVAGWLRARLTAAGGVVVDAPVDHLPSSCVAAYLRLKSTARI